jgi:hypothetical protein
MIYVKTHVVARRNARGGRSTQEHLVAALRRLPVRVRGDLSGLSAHRAVPAYRVKGCVALRALRYTDAGLIRAPVAYLEEIQARRMLPMFVRS